MMSISNMHGNLRNLPVKPLVRQQILIPSDKWLTKDGFLTKGFKFPNIETRNYFVERVLEYENEKQHFSNLIISKHSIIVKLTTENITQPTEIDKEFAKEVDALYKDAVYEKITYDDDIKGNSGSASYN